MGDVLRTTSILPTLSETFKNCQITWVTRKESVDLLEKNPFVDNILQTGGDALGRLQIEEFDWVINPETTKESAALATLARGGKKRGFGLAPAGSVFSYNKGAEELLVMGLFDDAKKKNQKTYEELICQLSDLTHRRIPPVLCLAEEEVKSAKNSLATALRPGNPVVGINTGGGTRWPLKRWTAAGFTELAKRMSRQLGVQILLLGGPAEEDINRQIAAGLGQDLIDTGCLNASRRFASFLNLCHVVVTGDSLALHIGLALRKRMVVLLGPTSDAEIDLYDRGSKITAPLDCLCCYRQTCHLSPNCMEAISVETVYRTVEEQLIHLHENR